MNTWFGEEARKYKSSSSFGGDTRTVDVHIKRLREKIKDHPSWGLSTVWGIGYKFEVK